ncbi:MAG: hypothetical protein WCR24_05275 [Candidatus Methanomethylophilaceae archaeon]
MDSKEAGNKVIRCTCFSEKTDVLLNPLMIIIAVVSYLVFAFYYLTIVREIEIEWTLPLHFVIAAYGLVVIGIALSMMTYHLILIRNYAHSKREKDLRRYLISYLNTRSAAKDIDITDDLARLIEIDADISQHEDPTRPRKMLCLILIPVTIVFASLAIDVMHNNLGEVTMVTMILILSIGLMTVPEVTSFPYDHEQHFAEFHERMRLVSERVGLDTVRFEPTVPLRSFDRLAKLSVCTLGVYSVFWAYLLFKDTNEHFRNQRIVENDFIDKMRKIENGGV